MAPVGPIQDDSTGFIYRWDASRSAYIVGTDTDLAPNGVVSGGCPENLIVPRDFSVDGTYGPVEVVGRFAFCSCGIEKQKYTKTILVTKQVKLIRQDGFGDEWDCQNFTIEQGSELEEIEEKGLMGIGMSTSDDNRLTKILYLPSNLFSIAPNGFQNCNLFDEIIYCGSNDLSINISDSIKDTYNPKMIIRVSSLYPANKFIGEFANKTEVPENLCYLPKAAKTPVVECTFMHPHIKFPLVFSLTLAILPKTISVCGFTHFNFIRFFIF